MGEKNYLLENKFFFGANKFSSGENKFFSGENKFCSWENKFSFGQIKFSPEAKKKIFLRYIFLFFFVFNQNLTQKELLFPY